MLNAKRIRVVGSDLGGDKLTDLGMLGEKSPRSDDSTNGCVS